MELASALVDTWNPSKFDSMDSALYALKCGIAAYIRDEPERGSLHLYIAQLPTKGLCLRMNGSPADLVSMIAQLIISNPEPDFLRILETSLVAAKTLKDFKPKS